MTLDERAGSAPSGMTGRLTGRISSRITQWSPARQLVAGMLLIAAVFVAIQLADYHQNVPSNDTYQYARLTLHYMGDSKTEAIHGATAMYCQDAGQAALRSASIDDNGTTDTGYEACLDVYSAGLTPNNARYLAIFDSRPGYPLMSGALATVFGLRLSMWLVALLCTLAASGLVLVLVRSAGGSVIAALAGQAVFLTAPTGYWGTRMLTDGPSLAATMVTVLGAHWLLRQRVRSGATLLVVGLVGGFAIRYSSEQMVVLLLTLAAGLLLRRVPSARTGGAKWLLGLGAVGTALSMTLTTALSWPGIPQSMQDTFTKHFIRPDVPNPLIRLISLNFHFWLYYPVLEPTALLMVLGLAVVGATLWRRDAVYAAPLIAVALSGLATVAAHPVSSQADRLMVAVWVLIAAGVPLLVSEWGRRRVPAAAASGAISAIVPGQGGPRQSAQESYASESA
ncbi:MAG: hypothetical protein ACRDVE_20910 [Actinocrinis sp.]